MELDDLLDEVDKREHRKQALLPLIPPTIVFLCLSIFVLWISLCPKLQWLHIAFCLHNILTLILLLCFMLFYRVLAWVAVGVFILLSIMSYAGLCITIIRGCQPLGLFIGQLCYFLFLLLSTVVIGNTMEKYGN